MSVAPRVGIGWWTDLYTKAIVIRQRPSTICRASYFAFNDPRWLVVPSYDGFLAMGVVIDHR